MNHIIIQQIIINILIEMGWLLMPSKATAAAVNLKYISSVTMSDVVMLYNCIELTERTDNQNPNVENISVW